MNNESAKWTHKSEYLWSCAGMPIKFNQSCSSQSQFLVRPSSLVEWNAPRSVHRTLDFGHRWASEAKWGSSSWALISAWDARETLGYGGVENTRGASLRWVEFTGWWVDNNHIRRWSALNKRYFILFSLCCLPAALCSFRSLQPPSCPSCFPSRPRSFFFFFCSNPSFCSVQFSSVLFCSVLFAFPATTFFFPFIVSVTKRRALYADCSLAQSFHRTRLPFPPSRPFWPCSLSLCFPQQQHAPILPVFPPFSSVFPYVCNWASISLGLLLLPFAIILVSRRTGQANAQWLPFLVLTGTNFICLYFAPRIAAWLFALHKVSGIVTRLLLNKPAVGPFRLAACPASSVLRLHLSSLLLRRRKCEFSTAFPSPLAQIWSKWEEKRERTAGEIDSGLGHYSRCFSQAQTFYYLKL